MNPNNIQSGWWITADDRFVRCCNTKEEAIAHIRFQKESMNSKASWHIMYIKMQFGEYIEI